MVSSLSLPAAPFNEVLSELATIEWRPELIVEEMPAPQRIAPFSVAMSGEVDIDGVDLATGRLIVLYDPSGNDAWNGQFRFVSYVKAEVAMEMVTDPLLAEVGWSWFEESLDHHHAIFTNPAGVVTAQFGRSFGEKAADPATAEIEIRASWTPDFSSSSISSHLYAWGDFLCLTAGLPILPPGVVSLTVKRPM